MLLATIVPAAAGAQGAAHDTVELSLLAWRPDASVRLSSDAPGAPGSPVDLHSDLAAADRAMPIVGVVIRPAKRHRIRFEYLPIGYDSSATLAQNIVFSGATYARGERVDSRFTWTAINVGYEYDFLMRARVTVGAIAEVKGTVVREQLTGPAADETRSTSVPAPALGAALRLAATPRLTIGGEFRGFVIPDSRNGHYGGRYVDVDGSGTFRIAARVGLRAGIRWLEIRHLGAADTARMSLPGLYAGIVLSGG